MMVAMVGINALTDGRGPTPGPTTSRPTPTRSSARPTRTPSTPTPRPPDLETQWSVQVRALRPELAKPEFTGALDGFMDTPQVVQVGPVWLVATGSERQDAFVLHALDPATGAERWRREAAQVRCATALLGGRLACAEAVRTDQATGLGDRWRLTLLDAETGAVTRETTVDAWVESVAVAADRLLVLEQREPAPRAVIRGWDASLAEQFTLDLTAQAGHEGMFSTSRVVIRKPSRPSGTPALDRPRLRTVGPGLTAFWVGRTTAFVDAGAGRLVGMPACSRLVDDGTRLWCNVNGRAVAHDHELRRLHQTASGVQLAFPNRDAQAGDRTAPVFLGEQGRVMQVDAATGATAGVLADTRTGSAFGLTTYPNAYDAGDLVLVRNEGQLFGIDPARNETIWTASTSRFDRVARRHGKVWLLGRETTWINPATGEAGPAFRQRHGHSTDFVGDALVGSGLSVVARLVLP